MPLFGRSTKSLAYHRVTSYLDSISRYSNPTDPAIPALLGCIIDFLDKTFINMQDPAMRAIADAHKSHPTTHTAILLCPTLPLEEYSKTALLALDDPSGILVDYLLNNSSATHASFWTSENKPLMKRLLTHPKKSVRLLGSRLASKKPIYNPPPTISDRIKSPLRKMLRR